MARRTRSSSVSKPGRKAQFFILSVFIMITILFVISEFIQPSSIFDTSSVVISDDVFTFNNIKEKAISVVDLSENCKDLSLNLEEYKNFIQKVATQKNQQIVFNYDLSSCKDSTLTTDFYVALVSTHSSEDATFTATKKRLLFIFFGSSAPEVVDVSDKQMDSRDFIMSFSTNILSAYPKLTREMLGYSFASVQDAMTTAKTFSPTITWIGYDNEKENDPFSTPPSELVDPAASTNIVADMVHAEGFKYGITPTRSILLQEYQSVDWTKVDMVVIQVQNANTNDFKQTVTDVSSFIRTKNIKTLIFVQVNQFLTDSDDTIVNDVISVRPMIDGVSIVCLASQGCNSDTAHRLDELITRLKAIPNT